MQDFWVCSLVWGDPLEEGMATHSSILALRIPMDTGAWRAAVHGVSMSWTQLSSSAHKQIHLLTSLTHVLIPGCEIVF